MRDWLARLFHRMRARKITLFEHYAVRDIAVDGLMVAENVGDREMAQHPGSRIERREDGSCRVVLPSRGLDIEAEELVRRWQQNFELDWAWQKWIETLEQVDD